MPRAQGRDFDAYSVLEPTTLSHWDGKSTCFEVDRVMSRCQEEILGRWPCSVWHTCTPKWWFPKIGLPPVITHILMGFSMKSTNHFGIPLYGNPKLASLNRRVAGWSHIFRQIWGPATAKRRSGGPGVTYVKWSNMILDFQQIIDIYRCWYLIIDYLCWFLLCIIFIQFCWHQETTFSVCVYCGCSVQELRRMAGQGLLAWQLQAQLGMLRKEN